MSLTLAPDSRLWKDVLFSLEIPMTPAQKRLQELRNRQSTERGRMAELSRVDALTDEMRSELDQIEQGTPDLERQLRGAMLAVEEEDREAKEKGAEAPGGGDPEQRARIELRSRASVGRYLTAALRGRAPDGAEAELQQAAGVDGIPFELWHPRQEQRDEKRAITAAPSTVGLNLDVLRPFVFAPSVVSRLMVDMPEIPSGTFASGTITTAATAGAVPKGGAGTTGDVPETAAQFTVTTSTPHRIGASLNLSMEDIASVGQQNFESLLREHISLAVSAELDDEMLNGDGSGSNITGFFARLSDPTAAPSATTDFDGFAAAHAGGIDGLWSNTLMDVMVVCGPSTMSLAARTFQAATNYKGEMSAAAYAMENTGGLWTNKRMPDAATFMTVDNVQQAILCRKGRSQMPSPMRTAVCGSYGYFTVDDIFSNVQKGQRRFVINTLITDLIIVQPDAYAQIAYRVA